VSSVYERRFLVFSGANGNNARRHILSGQQDMNVRNIVVVLNLVVLFVCIFILVAGPLLGETDGDPRCRSIVG
jgi:hypothetical protein